MPDTDLARESFGDFIAAALPGLLRFGHVLGGDPRKAEAETFFLNRGGHVLLYDTA